MPWDARVFGAKGLCVTQFDGKQVFWLLQIYIIKIAYLLVDKCLWKILTTRRCRGNKRT